MPAEIVNEWMRKAEEDWGVLQQLWNESGIQYPNATVFHAQQCAEKYLKAAIASFEEDPPRTHNLPLLLDILLALAPEPCRSAGTR